MHKRNILLIIAIATIIIGYLFMHNKSSQQNNSAFKSEDVQLNVTCPSNETCEVELGEELGISLNISNNSAADLGYPLAFRQSSGPSVLLVGDNTKQELQLATNPANFDLKTDWSIIKPGQSISFSWILHESELSQLLADNNKITAFISFADEVLIKNSNDVFETLQLSAQLEILKK